MPHFSDGQLALFQLDSSRHRPQAPPPPPATSGPPDSLIELPIIVTCVPHRWASAHRGTRRDGLAIGGRFAIATAPPGLSGIAELQLYPPDSDGDWLTGLPTRTAVRAVLRERASRRNDLIGQVLPLAHQPPETRTAVFGVAP